MFRCKYPHVVPVEVPVASLSVMGIYPAHALAMTGVQHDIHGGGGGGIGSSGRRRGSSNTSSLYPPTAEVVSVDAVPFASTSAVLSCGDSANAGTARNNDAAAVRGTTAVNALLLPDALIPAVVLSGDTASAAGSQPSLPPPAMPAMVPMTSQLPLMPPMLPVVDDAEGMPPMPPMPTLDETVALPPMPGMPIGMPIGMPHPGSSAVSVKKSDPLKDWTVVDDDKLEEDSDWASEGEDEHSAASKRGARSRKRKKKKKSAKPIAKSDAGDHSETSAAAHDVTEEDAKPVFTGERFQYAFFKLRFLKDTPLDIARMLFNGTLPLPKVECVKKLLQDLVPTEVEKLSEVGVKLLWLSDEAADDVFPTKSRKKRKKQSSFVSWEVDRYVGELITRCPRAYNVSVLLEDAHALSAIAAEGAIAGQLAALAEAFQYVCVNTNTADFFVNVRSYVEPRAMGKRGVSEKRIWRGVVSRLKAVKKLAEVTQAEDGRNETRAHVFARGLRDKRIRALVVSRAKADASSMSPDECVAIQEKATRASRWISRCESALDFGRSSSSHDLHQQNEAEEAVVDAFNAHVGVQPLALEDSVRNLKVRFTRLRSERATESKPKTLLSSSAHSISDVPTSEEERSVRQSVEAAIVAGEQDFARFLASSSRRDSKLFEDVSQAGDRLDAAIIECATKWQLEKKNLSCVVELAEALRQVASIMVVGGGDFGPAGGIDDTSSKRGSAKQSPRTSSPVIHDSAARRVSSAEMKAQVQIMRSKMGIDDEHGDEEDWGMDDSE
jgi:hypothetical protein